MSIWTTFTQLLPQYPLASVTSFSAMRDVLSASATDWGTQLAEASAAGDTAQADALNQKLVSATTLLAAMEPDEPSPALARAMEDAAKAGPATAAERAQQEATNLEESRKTEAQAVFLRNGKVEAVVYRDGVCYIYGEGPPGFHEFCENQQEIGEDCAIARVKKLAELWGDEVKVIDYANQEKRPTLGDFMDFQIAHPEMNVADAMGFLFPNDDDDEENSRRRAADEDYSVPVAELAGDIAAKASISTR